MRAIQSTLLICILGLAFLVDAQLGPSPAKGPGSPGGAMSLGPREFTTKFESLPSSTVASLSESRSSSSSSAASVPKSSTGTGKARNSTSVAPSATSNPTQIANTPTSSKPSVTGSFAGSSPVESGLSPTDSISEANAGSLSSQHRTLAIVLSSVLGSIGLVLAVLVLFLVCRYRKRRAFRRGVSPINDDEIESWRNTERKQSIQAIDRQIKHHEAGSIGLAWSPTAVQTPPAAKIARSASFLAKAPNARAGLTDEIIPGAAPFIPTVKRQSSRLSKAPPGHARTKSRRSSMSTKSVRSMNGGSFENNDVRMEDRNPAWYDPQDKMIGNHTFVPTLGTGSSPGTSIYDGLNEAGGLSPRPKPRPWANDGIGRAIS